MNRDDPPYVDYFERRRRVARRSVIPEMIGLRLNPEPEYPPPDPLHMFHPAPDPVYVPQFQPTIESNPEHEYHPGPEDPDEIYDPEPDYVEPLNDIFPVVPDSPDESHHSSVGDNFEYPEIQNLDNPNTDSDDLQFALNSNAILTHTILLDLEIAEQSTRTLKDQYLHFLTRVKEFYLISSTAIVQHPSSDWIRSILYHFPRTPLWICKTHTLLNEGDLDDFGACIWQLRHWVHRHM